MNASDIVKAKQNNTLHCAYYHPTVFQSTTYSTVNVVSSIINYVSSGYVFSSTSYTSTQHTVNTAVCNPTFMSYEMQQQVLSGKPVSELQWKLNTSTLAYAYSTTYSSFNNPANILPSSIRVTSTLVATGPGPVICPLVDYYQGNHASAC
jgi:hypothetical protein